MAKGRELKGRIRSVENTRKITRTLEMVATSKIKRAQDRVVAARPYASSLTEIISNLYTPELAERFPLRRQTMADASELIDDLTRRFADREIDAVHIVYAAYKSALSTPPTTQTVLPVAPPEQKGARPDYILLPSADAILTELLPSYVRNSV